MSRRRECLTASATRGFTLVELMTVVVIVSILAGVAIMSVGRSNRGAYLDGFAYDIRNEMTQARRRAISTRNVFLLQVNSTSVQWCQVTNKTDPDKISYAGLLTACPAVPAAGMEQSSLQYAGPNVSAVSWAKDVDKNGTGTYVGLPALLYFLPDGTVDSDLSTPPPNITGLTLRLQSNVETANQRKVLVYAYGGRPRVIDTW